MKKIMFVSYPLKSHNLPIVPYLESLVSGGFKVYHINVAGYEHIFSADHVEFIAYDNYEGLSQDSVSGGNSIFYLGQEILATAKCVLPFLRSLVDEIKPDLIAYPKFCLWGNLLGKITAIPTLNLTTGFVFDLTMVQQTSTEKPQNSILEGARMMGAAQLLYEEYGQGNPEMKEIFINRGTYNLALILKELQPEVNQFSDFRFIGLHQGDRVRVTEKKERIYISFGITFTPTVTFWEKLFSALDFFTGQVVVSAGKSYDELLSYHNRQVDVKPFVDQLAVLEKSTLFITHGGLTGIQEAILAGTPMLILPFMAEQIMNGERIQELGLGKVIPDKEVTSEELRVAVQELLENDTYLENVRSFEGDSEKFDLREYLQQIEGAFEGE